MKAKHKKYLLNVVKVIVFIALAFLVYWQMKQKSEDHNLWESFLNSFSIKRIPFLLFAVFLMPVNWFLESVKWRTFVKEFQPNFTIFKSFQSILCGALWGFLTPNRVGEFGGRLNKIEKENRGKALSAGYWGGIAQFMVTFGLGIYFGGKTVLNYVDTSIVEGFTIPLAIVIMVGAVYVFFNFKWFVSKIQRFPLLKRITKTYQLDFKMPKPALGLILFITIMRYVIYVNQYVYLMYFFGIELDYYTMFSSVSTMLVLHTCIPSVPFVDVVVKQNALLILLKGLTQNELSILLAVTSIWIINIVIPAIAGYFFFSKIGSKKA